MKYNNPGKWSKEICMHLTVRVPLLTVVLILRTLKDLIFAPRLPGELNHPPGNLRANMESFTVRILRAYCTTPIAYSRTHCYAAANLSVKSTLVSVVLSVRSRPVLRSLRLGVRRT
jgi:hypothetical protein